MKIKSNTKDYYDKVQSFGVDDLLYVRYPKIVDDIPVNLKDIGRHNKSRFTWRNVKIGFCGKLYTGYYFYGPDLSTKYLYTLDEVEQLYKDRKWKFNKDPSKYYGHEIYRDFVKVAEQNATEFFKPYFEKYLTPIFVCNETKNKIDQCEINGRLRDYNFQTVFSVVDAYQEIMMYLGNMAFPNRPIPAISDEDMLEAKGFDLRFSFRKDPKK